MTKPTYGSLFTGVGGFDMGFDQQGYTCKWQVEWDKHCQQTLAHHWPNTPRYGDVQTVNGFELQPVDVIIYGSPCQDLSTAGRRQGLDGQKSSMFYESIRIFKEMRNATAGTYPRITVWENVPGALSSNKGHDFKTVLTELENIGALAQWWNVLDAQHFGVPQRRRRVFLISIFDPAIIRRTGDGPLLPVSESSTRNPKKIKPQRENPATNPTTSTGEPSQLELIAFSHSQIDALPTHTHTRSLRATGGQHAIMVRQTTQSDQ